MPRLTPLTPTPCPIAHVIPLALKMDYSEWAQTLCGCGVLIHTAVLFCEILDTLELDLSAEISTIVYIYSEGGL